MKTVTDKIYDYLHSNHEVDCMTLAKEIVKIVQNDLADQQQRIREQSEEFDRDRYADDNKGWKSTGFTDANGWTHL